MSPPRVATHMHHSHPMQLLFDARLRRGRALLRWGVALSVSGDFAGAASALAAASAARPGHAQMLVALVYGRRWRCWWRRTTPQS